MSASSRSWTLPHSSRKARSGRHKRPIKNLHDFNLVLSLRRRVRAGKRLRWAFEQAACRLNTPRTLVHQRLMEMVPFKTLPCASCGTYVATAARLDDELRPVCARCE